jgi:hypothetical protein
MVTIATLAAPAFAATETVTPRVPVPLAGLTVTQPTPLVAVHPQAGRLVPTVTVPAPPAAAMFRAFADKESEHGAPAWVTVKLWPAIVKVAVRAAPVLAAIVTTTVPEPVPLVGPTVAQVAPLDAVQLQFARLHDTVTLLVPLVAAAETLLLDSAYVQAVET